MSDWHTHLSTLFPEARLKTFIEVRQADASSREMVRALPAFWRGILYDANARAGGLVARRRLVVRRAAARLSRDAR